MNKRDYVALFLVIYRSWVIQINPRSATPVYRQLADHLRGLIESGVLGPGDPLPSETELEEESGLARGTVRKAVAALRDDGLIVTTRGKGSFVIVKK